MDKAKAAVASFVSRDGKHQTDIHQDTRDPVTEEHVRPHQHENVTTAVDKEIHQDHHQTKIQPLVAKETRSEKHHAKMAPVEHRSFEHDDASAVRNYLERDAKQYGHTSTEHEATHSSTVAPTVESQHVHHHVHEHIQPVIQKETVDPHVVHTTVPIHETHHATSMQHGTTTLPAKTLEEFQAGGGKLVGKGSTKLGEYEGCPKTIEKSGTEHSDVHPTTSRGVMSGTGLGSSTSTGRNESSSNKGYSLTGAMGAASAAATSAFSGSKNTSTKDSTDSYDSTPRTMPDGSSRTIRSGSENMTSKSGKEQSLMDKVVHKTGL